MICAYAADATDFSNNGLGALKPIECTVSETLNGMWQLTLTHAIDDEKSARLAIGNIIRAPVPAGFTPALKYGGGATAGKEIYKVTTDGRRLYLRSEASQTSKGLHAYRPDTEVSVLDKSNSQWYEVTTPDGRHGYMWAANLAYVRTEESGEAAEESIKEAEALRDQPFRIYKIVPDLQTVTVYARHIFYDLADNLLGACEGESESAATAASKILNTCRGEGSFRIYSDLDASITYDWTDKTPVEAILGSEGLIELTGAELARDWWDIYAVKRVGRDNGVTVRQGKNLKSLGGSLDVSDVITRIVPVGTDADGNALYLPEVYVDSELISNYPLVKWGRVDVSEAKEVKSGKNKRTKEECYTLMREAAQAEFAAGCDSVAHTLDIDFVNPADTVEMAAWAGVCDLSLGDSVRVIAPAAGVDVTMRITDYVYDCLAKRYTSLSLGTVCETIAASTLSAKQLPSAGVTGTKIAPGAVSAGKIADGSVNSLKIALAAIQYAHIEAACIKQLSTDALTAIRADIRQLVAGSITTDQLYADLAAIAVAQITTANIDKADIAWADIAKLTAEIATVANAQIGSAKIDWAKIYDLTADTAIITEGVGGKLYIARLAVNEANMTSLAVGELMVKAADGSFKRITVDADGTVTGETVTVEGDNIGEATISGSNLIEDTITARELNVESIFADTALINAVKAANIDVGDLFAATATITALDAYIIKAETIQALEGQLNLWATDKITAAVTGDLTPTSVSIGSSITMDKDHTEISTPYLDIDVSGTNGDMHIDEDGISASVATFDSINCDAVVKRVAGRDITITSPGGLQEELSRLNGCQLDGSETITLACDQYGDITMHGIQGNNTVVTIKGSFAINGNVTIVDCHAQRIAFEGVTIDCSSQTAIAIYSSAWVKISGCVINTSSSYDGVQISAGAVVMMEDTAIYNAGNALNVYWGGRLDFLNLRGTGITYLWARGCIVTGNGSRPSGNWVGQNVISNYSNMEDITIDTGSATPAADPVTTTSYTASMTATYYPSGHWIGDNSLIQGRYNTTRHYACMWFSGASALSSKTVKSATLTIKRISGAGKSSSVNLTLYTTPVTGKSGNPTSGAVSLGTLGTAANGESVTVNLPVSAIAVLASGGALMLDPGDTANASGKKYSTNYARFEGTDGTAPVLQVTYQ